MVKTDENSTQTVNYNQNIVFIYISEQILYIYIDPFVTKPKARKNGFYFLCFGRLPYW